MGIINNSLIDDKVDLIIKNNIFQYNLRKIEDLEKNRKYCKHDMQHFLDVARIMYIISLENDFNIPKYIIYTTALLHDIGRGEQYENGTAHNIASVQIAKEILHQCEYGDKQIDEILEAIGNHRNETESFEGLSNLLYKCDKLSRDCVHCEASEGCKWPLGKRNFKINY
ncbi:HD domain-containing protein [Clostridium estertheticum]|uniref:HD domain-containing protein n=1 Tax=Clostridium estertheticum TaxID=238834 RepID=UPI0022DDB70C|nr:HD domain-containing protein [Clostridium estertheticum]WBL46560.1 HD domain-containing protein [Clostridium estertheticum]